jgi:hypothetical protein
LLGACRIWGRACSVVANMQVRKLPFKIRHSSLKRIRTVGGGDGGQGDKGDGVHG